MTRTYPVILFVLALIVGLGAPAQAQHQEPGAWSAEIEGLVLSSTEVSELDDPIGAGIGVGYRLNDRFGLSLNVQSATIEEGTDAEISSPILFEFETELRVTLALAQLDVHLTPRSSFDLVVGPILGYADYGDLKLTGRVRAPGFGQRVFNESFPTDGGFVWGGHVGFEVPLGASRAYFTGAARYVESEVDIEGPEVSPACVGCEGPQTFDLNPLTASVGIGIRF